MSAPHSLRKRPHRCLLRAIHLLALTFALLNSTVRAQRLTWRPTDFTPMTELPWKDASRPMPKVLEIIFKDPGQEIRHAVLAGYLRTIPLNQFDTAFELCTTFEGCQNPDEVVSLLLEVWAERDPESAWVKTQALFGATVIDADPLQLDNWDRPKIRVVNHEALQQSPFWLTRNTLGYFQDGVQRSNLKQERKEQLIAAFKKRCVEAFGESWDIWKTPSMAARLSAKMLEVLMADEAVLRKNILEGHARQLKAAHIQASALRWLALQPDKAEEILKTVQEEADWPPDAEIKEGTFPYSPLFFLLWSKLDIKAMVRWTETHPIKDSEHGSTTRALLMSRVDEITRQRWLREAKAACPKDDPWTWYDLLLEWVSWNPEQAFQECVAVGDPELLQRAAQAAVYTSIHGPVGCHWGLGIIRDFDLRTAGLQWIQAKDYDLLKWGTPLLERWYKIDMGEAARYGFHFLTVLWPEYMPREDLIKMFSGDPECCSDSDMIDRTLCCMRFWAMWKPDEMRKWIQTLEKADMRKALTWTLENPWGNGKE